ncbi:MAG: hypothetical protein ACLFP8_07575 [Alphaproteobacteria bacterium]
MLFALSGLSLPRSSCRSYTKSVESSKHRFCADRYDYRAVCLFCACILYAFFGSPTPDRFGVVEISLTVLLLLGVGVSSLHDVMAVPLAFRFWKSAGQFLMVYGLTIPLLAGSMSGAQANVILRDLLAFLFLFLPLLYLPVIRAKPQYFRTTLLGLVLIGLLFSLRSLVMRFGVTCRFDSWCTNDALLYLENMPTVLFSCLLLIGSAIVYVMRPLSVRYVLASVFLILLALVPLSAMVLTLQRASVGALVVYIALVYTYFLYHFPGRALKAFGFGALALCFFWVYYDWVFSSLWEKTRSVGLNMRMQELRAVWNVVSADPLTLLFGIGWGGQFHSPAVGGLSVNFTHNFFSSMLLKSGLMGMMLSAAYIFGLLERLLRVVFKNPVFGMAVAAPVLIDLTLYASFKSLDFGLVLLLIPASLVYFRQFESHNHAKFFQ